MNKIKMTDDEIVYYFYRDGQLRIKQKYEEENHKKHLLIVGIEILLFWWVQALAMLFEFLSNVFSNLMKLINKGKYAIERVYYKKRYLKSYIIPTKKEIKEAHKRVFEEEE